MINKDLVKENLTLEDIYTVLEECGGNPTFQGTSAILADTICHSEVGEGSHKLYYYDNTKLFHCYTDCGGSFDIFELIQKVKKIQELEDWSMPKVVFYLANKFNLAAEEENNWDEYEIEDWKIFKEYDRILSKDNKEVDYTLKEYNRSILKAMLKVRIATWEKEGISKSTIDRFGICYYPKDCHIIIPHEDENNRLVGIRRRTLIEEEGEIFGKYKPALINRILYNHPLGFSLYGLNKTKENIRAVRKAIVFEGER